MGKKFIGNVVRDIIGTISNEIISKQDNILEIPKSEIMEVWDTLASNDIRKHLFYKSAVPTGNVDIHELPDDFMSDNLRRYELLVKIFSIGTNDWWCQTHSGNAIETIRILFNGPLCTQSYPEIWVNDKGWPDDFIIYRYNYQYPSGKKDIVKDKIIYLDGVSNYNINFMMNLHKIFRLTSNGNFDPKFYYLFNFNDNLGGYAYNDSSKKQELELGPKYLLPEFGQFNETKVKQKITVNNEIIKYYYEGITFASCYNH